MFKFWTLPTNLVNDFVVFAIMGSQLTIVTQRPKIQLLDQQSERSRAHNWSGYIPSFHMTFDFDDTPSLASTYLTYSHSTWCK